MSRALKPDEANRNEKLGILYIESAMDCKTLFTDCGLLVTKQMFIEKHIIGKERINFKEYKVLMVETLEQYIERKCKFKIEDYFIDNFISLWNDMKCNECDEYDDDYYTALEELFDLAYDCKNHATSELIKKLDQELLENVDISKLREEFIQYQLDDILEDLDIELDDADATLEWVQKEWSPDLDEEDKDLMFEDMMITLFDITETLENTLDQIKLITA